MDFADRTGFVGRMIGAARFERETYRQIAADDTAMVQAAGVVVLGALAGGASAALSVSLAGGEAGGFATWLIISTLLVLLGWVTWSGVTWFVGTRVMHSQATFGEVARSLGFAQSPSLLRIFGFVPILGGLVQVAASFWGLATGFYAIRETFRLETRDTIVTVIVGFIAYTIIVVVIGAGLIAAFVGAAADTGSTL